MSLAQIQNGFLVVMIHHNFFICSDALDAWLKLKTIHIIWKVISNRQQQCVRQNSMSVSHPKSWSQYQLRFKVLLRFLVGTQLIGQDLFILHLFLLIHWSFSFLFFIWLPQWFVEMCGIFHSIVYSSPIFTEGEERIRLHNQK